MVRIKFVIISVILKIVFVMYSITFILVSGGFAYIGGNLNTTDLYISDIYQNSNSEYGWYLLYTRKNLLLDNSVFLKCQYKSNTGITDNLKYCCEYGIGVFYFPNIFSIETNFESESAVYTSVRTTQKFLLNHFLINGLSTESAFCFNLGHNPGYGFLDDYGVGLFTHIQTDYGLSYCRELFSNYNFKLSFSDLFRTSAYFPLDIFRNTEVAAGIENNFFNLKYVYPLSFELKRDNYPYQDKRIQLSLKKNWFGYETRLESIFQPKNNWYSISINKQIKSIYLKSYIAMASEKISGGIGISFGIDTLPLNPYIYRDSVNGELKDFVYTDKKNTLPANINTYSLDNLQATINTPQQAEEYVHNYINYADDHNDISGLFEMYNPNYVFSQKRGNCTEQARLQALLLADNGYDMRIVGHIGYRWAHAILFYKDLVTGRWKAIDNTQGKEYYIESDNIVELQNIVYPGWFNIVVKDKDGKGLYQVDSETKWYIQDWFNQ